MDRNDNNVYAPPTAVVADPPSTEILETRPRQVNLAILLMWIAGVGPYAIRRIYQLANEIHDLTGGTLSLIAISVSTLLYVLLTLGLAKGKNWVRVTYLVLSAFGSLSLLQVALMKGVAEKLYYGSPILIANAAMQQLLFAASLVLVFTKPGSKWFRKRTE